MGQSKRKRTDEWRGGILRGLSNELARNAEESLLFRRLLRLGVVRPVKRNLGKILV